MRTLSLGVGVSATVPPTSSGSHGTARAPIGLLWGALGAAAAGVLTGVSVPTAGVWPLAYVGMALLALLLWTAPLARRRALYGWLYGTALFLFTLPWVIDLHVAGYFGLTLIQSLFYAAGALFVVGRRPLIRLANFTGVFTLVEWARSNYPWGGFPMAGIPVGQGVGPLAALARLGGVLAVTAGAAALGATLGLAALAWWPRHKRVIASSRGGPETETATARVHNTDRKWPPSPSRSTAVAVISGMLSVVAAVGLAWAVPAPHTVGSIRVAVVQGGGPLGIRAVDTSPEGAFRRHVQATETIPQNEQLDLILWPENVVSTEGPVIDHPWGAKIAELARAYRTYLAAGVVEGANDDTRFYNAEVLWGPDGSPVSRYDKVHRVPFGEYVPSRSFFRKLDDLRYIPRDAVPGDKPGVFHTPKATYAVVISYEGFYGDRSRAGLNEGGQVLLVPTNASSYVWEQVANQQVAAAQLRAWESGRWVLQSSPTGVSAVVDGRGRVLERTTRITPAVLIHDVPLVDGTTPYLWMGDGPPAVIALLLALVGPLSLAWKRRLLGSVGNHGAPATELTGSKPSENL